MLVKGPHRAVKYSCYLYFTDRVNSLMMLGTLCYIYYLITMVMVGKIWYRYNHYVIMPFVVVCFVLFNCVCVVSRVTRTVLQALRLTKCQNKTTYNYIALSAYVQLLSIKLCYFMSWSVMYVLWYHVMAWMSCHDMLCYVTCLQQCLILGAMVIGQCITVTKKIIQILKFMKSNGFDPPLPKRRVT